MSYNDDYLNQGLLDERN